MAAVDDVDEGVEHYALAAAEFIKGNPEPYKMVFSHQEDVTFANPYGPPVHGWEQVAQTMERAASYIRDGKIAGFENVAKYVTPRLAYVVAIERGHAKFGGRKNVAHSHCELR